RRGGKSFKWASPALKGVPDRLVMLPGGKVGFLELKAPGKKPTTLQQYYLDVLSSLGFTAGYADTKESVNQFLDRLQHA
ncbi:MAG: VRR-NUC domain-containing protein, partial [Pseudomonadota bacterium]